MSGGRDTTCNGAVDRRQAPRLFDCFPFFNEVDLLELRMEQHYPHVDYMVLAEATRTFSGLPKPLHYNESKARFRRFADKIIHVIVEDDVNSTNAWAREKFQRDAIARGLGEAGPGDVVLLGDLDELLRDTAFQNLRRSPLETGDVRCFELRWYQHYFNLKLPGMWLRNGPRAARCADIPSMSRLRAVKGPAEKGPQERVRQVMASLSMRRLIRRSVERDAGWHFSWLGGADSVAEKLKAIPPQVGLQANHAEAAVHFVPTLEKLKADRSIFSIETVDDSFPAFLSKPTPFVTRHVLPADL